MPSGLLYHFLGYLPAARRSARRRQPSHPFFREHVMVINLAREVPPDKKYLYDMVHFNDTGSQLAAKLIAASLESLVE